MKIIIDTNLLMEVGEKLFEKYQEIIIPLTVLEELDKLKISDSENKACKARNAVRLIEKYKDHIHIENKISSFSLPISLQNNKSSDNEILALAKDLTINNDVCFVSMDLNMIHKAKALDILCELWKENNKEDTYTGYKYINIDEIELANWYQNEIKVNKWGLKVNEYAIFRVDGEVIDTWVWTLKGFRHLSTKKIDSQALGKFKAFDEIQLCAVDALSNSQMTMIRGKAGSGKSIISLSYAMAMIEKGKADKLIVFVNPIATKNSAKLGFLPGSKDEKLLDSQVGNMFSSKFGSRMAVEGLIKQEKIIFLPFSDIRGFDTNGTKSIVYIVEAQNLDKELMKLAIQRVGDDCQLIIDGDNHTQVDLSVFEGSNNGMTRTSEIFRGQDFYSEIVFSKIYRSRLAEIADQM